MMLTQGLTKLVVDVGADITNGEVGTSETVFSEDQTGVVSAVASTDVALLDKTVSSATVNCNHQITTAKANGSTITEFELNDGSSVAYNRCLRAPFAKTAEIEFNLLHTLEFQVVN